MDGNRRGQWVPSSLGKCTINGTLSPRLAPIQTVRAERTNKLRLCSIFGTCTKKVTIAPLQSGRLSSPHCTTAFVGEKDARKSIRYLGTAEEML